MGRHKGKMFILNCKICGKKFKITPSRINITKCCSRKCRDIFTKGKHYSSKTEFKKGQHSSRKTEFKKGMIPWDKGLKGIFVGKKAHHWKNGKTISRGYLYIFKPKHPFCNHKGYIPKHRLVMEKHLGRFLKLKEVVHHINRNTLDNRLKNLKLFANNGVHISYHGYKNKNLPVRVSNK